MTYDFFISHASEDKAVVRPLVKALESRGYRVWYDEDVLKVGDSLSSSIDSGLGASRYGVVVLSPAFFSKHWTRRELQGLISLDEQGRSKILPIWHNVTKAEVTRHSPTIADIIAAKTSSGISHVVDSLVAAVDLASPPGLANDVGAIPNLPVTRRPVASGGELHVAFVHGIYGSAATWTGAINRLSEDRELGALTFSTFVYSAKLDGIGQSMKRIAHALSRDLEKAVVRGGNRQLVLVGHSFGGLIAQLAILDSPIVRGCLARLVLVAVPSGGLRMAGVLGFFARGLKELTANSHTLVELQQRWAVEIGPTPPFHVQAFVADQDVFASSAGLPGGPPIVLHGTHTGIIEATGKEAPIVQFLRREIRLAKTARE